MRAKQRRLTVLALVFCLFLSGVTVDTCAAGKEKGAAGNREAVHAHPLSRMVCDTLYFGMSTPNGEISEEQWMEFLDTVVTARFPDGFTVYDSHGQWRDKTGQIQRERSKVLQIVHRSGAEYEKAVRETIKEYKVKFSQESVLRVRGSVQVSF